MSPLKIFVIILMVINLVVMGYVLFKKPNIVITNRKIDNDYLYSSLSLVQGFLLAISLFV